MVLTIASIRYSGLNNAVYDHIRQVPAATIYDTKTAASLWLCEEIRANGA
jgi:hypothetical protein